MISREQDLLQRLAQPSDQRILLVVLDGIGGLPINGQTELEAASTPNLDKLAASSELGLSDPIFPGITPGSGIAHLALFGYDPLTWDVGRGAVAAAGVGLALAPGQVAARANFVTQDADGVIQDRRAGRMGSDEARRVVGLLQDQIKEIDGVGVEFAHVMEYRICVKIAGTGLGDAVSDTDPQAVGKARLSATSGDDASARTAELMNLLLQRVDQVLANEPVANGLVTRGVAAHPAMPSITTLHQLKAQVIASYPDYRGVAGLAGMDVHPIPGEGELFEEKISAYEASAAEYDFTFLHVKKTDSYGEDKNFSAKVGHIEAFDALLPRLLAALGDQGVIVLTGDHSTPALMGTHSWHPVPLLIRGPYQRAGSAGRRWTETDCLTGTLGRLPAQRIMGLALAQADRLKKYGA